MTVSREQLADERDQAFRDIIALEAQVDAGEVPPEAAARLRAEYEQTAAEAMKRLLQADDTPAPRRSSWTRAAIYLATVVLAGVAAIIVLPGAVAQRPQNGFVTGNEMLPAATTPSLPPGIGAAGTALWMQANVELFARNDPAAALRTLQQLRAQPGLSPQAQQDVDAMIGTARRELAKAGR